ncbi:MAG: hypothetical protein EOQ39_00525 [Mesorhizobium sp.]|uniref:hypothetical protein n=1 Tax=Mesorhizobium sp. TaxID=1871066 RepID=UPI000FE54CF8|nr:hypothetical protein [Mesorhizobium sp.]RWB00172.1 MAG: hypothetical protein EOQ37_30055 [Mesorhizobium sp.]RWB18056.1 MAG: hypothetical protein EOQ39_00525 [Mesorhizobium sp.]
MIELRPLRDPVGCANPSDAGKPTGILAAAIMSLAEGFARDGIGASSLGFEIFVRWTSLEGVAQFDHSGRTRLVEYATNDNTET